MDDDEAQQYLRTVRDMAMHQKTLRGGGHVDIAIGVSSSLVPTSPSYLSRFPPIHHHTTTRLHAAEGFQVAFPVLVRPPPQKHIQTFLNGRGRSYVDFPQHVGSPAQCISDAVVATAPDEIGGQLFAIVQA